MWHVYLRSYLVLYHLVTDTFREILNHPHYSILFAISQHILQMEGEANKVPVYVPAGQKGSYSSLTKRDRPGTTRHSVALHFTESTRVFRANSDVKSVSHF